MYGSIQHINKLDLALTSVCNAKCLDCARWWVDDESQYHNPADTHANHHWPIDQLKHHLDQLTHIKSILICGNAGDPFAHPQLADICEWMMSRWHAHISIDTNGSLGTDATWQRLAQLDGVEIRFAVDGLDETNHIYRRGVSWPRVKHNILAWHRLGGEAVLKTIDFPWNEPDRHSIQQWANDLGWSWQLDARWSPEMDEFILKQSRTDADIMQWPKDRPEMVWDDDSTWQEHVSRRIDEWQSAGGHIEAECRSYGDWIYINHDHTVWPCCYWANSLYVQDRNSREHLKWMLKDQPPQWNSLDHHELRDIIQSPILQNIEKLWEGNNINSTSMLCIKHCGRCQTEVDA